MSGKIFINYRRGDEPGFALALYGRLELSFSPEQLFMDVEGGIPAGHDFVQVLGTQLAQCDVLLALIGQGWLTAADDSGARRLANPDDFVRIEIESAMRLGKHVIPVLVNKAEMPRVTDLPEPLQPLARRNAVRLTQERFRADVQGLVTAIESALHETEVARAAATAETETMLRRQREEQARTEAAARAEKQQLRPDANAGLSPEQKPESSSSLAHKVAAGCLAIFALIVAIVLFQFLKPDDATVRACINAGGSGNTCPGFGAFVLGIPTLILILGFAGAAKVWRG